MTICVKNATAQAITYPNPKSDKIIDWFLRHHRQLASLSTYLRLSCFWYKLEVLRYIQTIFKLSAVTVHMTIFVLAVWARSNNKNFLDYPSTKAVTAHTSTFTFSLVLFLIPYPLPPPRCLNPEVVRNNQTVSETSEDLSRHCSQIYIYLVSSPIPNTLPPPTTTKTPKSWATSNNK